RAGRDRDLRHDRLAIADVIQCVIQGRCGGQVDPCVPLEEEGRIAFEGRGHGVARSSNWVGRGAVTGGAGRAGMTSSARAAELAKLGATAAGESDDTKTISQAGSRGRIPIS